MDVVLRVLGVERLAGSPVIGREIGHLRVSRREVRRSPGATRADERGARGECVQRWRQVDGRVRGRGLLRSNMGKCTTLRHMLCRPRVSLQGMY